MTTRYASCSCGQLSAQVSGEPVRVSICHCLACQRRTGGPFAQQARYPRENVQVSGQSTSYFRAGADGAGVRGADAWLDRAAAGCRALALTKSRERWCTIQKYFPPPLIKTCRTRIPLPCTCCAAASS